MVLSPMQWMLRKDIYTVRSEDWERLVERAYVAMEEPLCRAMMMKGMVFRYTWVYSREDTMAHTRRLVVTS